MNDEVEPVERPQVFWGLYGAGFHVGWAGFGRLSRGDHSYITLALVGEGAQLGQTSKKHPANMY